MPQTIHNMRIRGFAFPSSAGNVFGNTAGSITAGAAPRPAPRPSAGAVGIVAAAAGHNMDAKLNAPIQANVSRWLSPTYNDSAPPIDSPAIARCSRFLLTLYALSTMGITSSNRIFVYPVMFSPVRPPTGPVDVP